MPFAATWMELETLILSEVRKRKTNTTWYHLYLVSNIRHKWTFSTEKKIMHLENRLVVAWGEREGVGWIGSLGLTDRCKLLLLEWISNEILPCSTENYVWSLMMEHDNGEKRIYTCMCNWVTMLYSRKLTKHCKPATMEKIKISYNIYIFIFYIYFIFYFSIKKMVKKNCRRNETYDCILV